MFIAKKKDRFGHRFGFVRFKDINDPSRLIAKLNTIWLGNLRLKVNLPRFDREHKERSIVNRPSFTVNHYNNGTRNGTSFATMVKTDGRRDKVGSIIGNNNN